MAYCSNCGDKANKKGAKFCSKCGTALGKGSAKSTRVVETTFSNKCHILADLWMNYRTEEEWEDFVEYNDLGLPLAYILENGIAVKNDESVKFINETFDLLLGAVGIEVDQGFEDYEELLEAGG